jgi:hypothetical protein
MADADVTIGAWTPREWVCNCFPQPAAGVEVVSLDYILAALDRHTAAITEADSTALGAAMHAAHILVTLQGPDGLWPQQLNLRTGRGIGEARSAAPISLMRRLNALLYSTEYDYTIGRAEAASAAHSQAQGSQDATNLNTEYLNA